jgi:hypothetical protein
MTISYKDLILQDDAISNQISLLRFTSGEQRRVIAIITQLQKDLRVKLLGDLTDFGRARVNKLLRESTSIINSAYKAVQLELELDFPGLAKQQSDSVVSSFAGIGLGASLPTEAALKALVNESLIEGAPSAAWWAKQSDDTAFKFKAQVSQGIAGNETVQKIVRRIVGSPRLGTPGIMETSRRGAAALVHTSIQQVSNDARIATFKANGDIVKGVMQLSTLDSHTTKICIAYSGQSWDLKGNPIDGSTLPFNGGTPRHFNCRSVLTPITKTYKELGIDIPEAPPGTRASDLGQVPATTTFESFLDRHNSEYMDDLLGPGRAKLYRDGKITLTQLVNQQGRPLTLK